MPSRRTITALAGLLAALVAVIVVFATASTGGVIGRARAHLGDAADSLGDSLTLPSPSPTALPTAATFADNKVRVEAQATRLLLDAALGHLALGTSAGNLAASAEYDKLLISLDEAGRSSDVALIAPLFRDAGYVRSELLKRFPRATPTP